MADVLFAIAAIALLASISVPQLTAGLDRSRALAAAHYLASQLRLARLQAATRSAAVAVRLVRVDGDVAIAMAVDGNGNGVHAGELDAGVDARLGPAVPLGQQFPGVFIESPVPFEDRLTMSQAGDMLSFSPEGSAFSGTMQVTGRDGSRFAVRVLGPTGRVRVLRWDPGIGDWVDAI